ncbi:MAG: TAXI family TRAP transporter solute-binding subunit [bacterium]
MKRVFGVLILVVVLILAGCSGAGKGPQGEDSKPEEPKRLNVATATTGGAYYPAGLAAAQLWTEKGGFQASASTSAGSVENIDLLSKGEANIVCVQADILHAAYSGEGKFEGQEHKELRILAPILSQHYNMVIRKGAGINSINDWKGQRVVVGRAGSGTVVTHERVLETFGISIDDINASYLGQSEAIEAIRNGLADATIAVGAAPLSAVSDAVATPGSNALIYSLTEEEVKALGEHNWWMVPMPIPAGTYPNQDKEINAVGHNGFFVVREDFPEDLAHKLVKLMYEEKDWLQDAYSGFKSPAFLEPGLALEQISVPAHPGTIKYLKEANLMK